MTTEDRESWLELRVEDVDPDTFEIRRMSRLLGDLSQALVSIARQRYGTQVDRPGPITPSEGRVASFRVVKIAQGSLLIELAPPPRESQTQLELPGEPSPEDVAYDFYRTLEEVSTGQISANASRDVVRRVRTVVQDLSEFGPRVEMKFRPQFPDRLPERSEQLRGVFDLRHLPEEVMAPRSHQRRRLVGHTFMVDVEPGKERIRLKLADGRDLTLAVDEQTAASLEMALNRTVEVEIDEESEDGGSTRRTIHQLDVVVPQTAVPPPRTIAELELAQGMPAENPDYIQILSKIWQEEADVEEFEAYVSQIRHKTVA